MANGVYDSARALFLGSATAVLGTSSGTSIDWLLDNIKAALIHNSAGGTSYNGGAALTTGLFLSDANISAATVATSPNLGSKTNVAGVAGCANIVFTSVSGVQVDGILIYKDTGTPSASPLVAWIDTATGLPVVPNGSNITINIDTGANKLFKL